MAHRPLNEHESSLVRKFPDLGWPQDILDEVNTQENANRLPIDLVWYDSEPPTPISTVNARDIIWACIGAFVTCAILWWLL